MSLKHNILYSSLLLLGACGTIFSGSTQTISFDSNIKENIDIYANGALVCTKTPCVVDIDRGSAPLTIIAKAKGYEDSVMQDKAKINTVSWGNLLSVYSWTTDFATSSMWKYYHEQPQANPNASFYDIRAYFQGRDKNGKMNKDSADAQYMALIGSLRQAQKVLAAKIAEKVYKYGFLKG